MEKHIYTQAQCAMLEKAGLKQNRTLFGAFEDLHTCDLLDYLPKAISIEGETCLLVIIRVFIPKDTMDPEQPFVGWTWEAGYSSSCSDDFEVSGIGEEMADALCGLYLELHDRGIL